ncbi:hypothetical protein GCM10009603_43270 [Nocardiopsis exhalans]
MDNSCQSPLLVMTAAAGHCWNPGIPSGAEDIGSASSNGTGRGRSPRRSRRGSSAAVELPRYAPTDAA